MILGITGGIGCGKSTVAGLLAQAGFELIDSDAMVRERVLTNPIVRDQLRGRFGAEVLHADETVNRARLAERVFVNDEDRIWLEELTHPQVFALWRETLATRPRDHRWVLEVPLLFEKRLENWFDFTVCVASSPEQQFARLEQRGLARPLAEQRISKQLPLAQKIELSDFVLWNDGSTAFLQRQVEQLIATLPHAR